MDFSFLSDQFGIALDILKAIWWVVLPIILAAILIEVWKRYIRTKYLLSLKWALLEVMPPPEIPLSSPRVAESFFAGLHASYAGFPGTSWKSQFFLGKVPVWFSFEIVSNAGETHFYIRCLEKQRNTVEALIFAQYPETEIRVVPDYVDALPSQLDLEQYDISGSELEFTKEQAYPIKTYVEFEEAGGKDEYARIDPLAPLLEAMSALRPGEHLWLQFIVRATGGDWVKEGQKVTNKIKGKKEEPIVSSAEKAFKSIESSISSLTGTVPEKKEEKKEEFNLQKLSPAEKKVLEQVEYKLAKLAFKTGIRLVYLARRDVFNDSRVSSVVGMFKQLYYNNLNSFKPNKKTGTRQKGILKWAFPSDVGFFAAERSVKSKRVMYKAYRQRAFPEYDGKEILCILTTEELATLWHLPGLNVRAPLLPRISAKKGQPPVGLPTK